MGGVSNRCGYPVTRIVAPGAAAATAVSVIPSSSANGLVPSEGGGLRRVSAAFNAVWHATDEKSIEQAARIAGPPRSLAPVESVTSSIDLFFLIAESWRERTS